MVQSLEYQPIIKKLLHKTQEGRVPWEQWGGSGRFRCVLEGFIFFVTESGDGYEVTMQDLQQNSLFSVKASEEIIFTDKRKEEMYTLLSDLYELARRKALQVPEKLAEVVSVLDKI